MPTRRVYSADDEVIEECRTRGVTMTPRQLERWRHCLPRRRVVHARGVRGSRTVNPPGYVDQVIAVHDLLAEGVSLREAPMVLFARGYAVEPDALQAAYLGLFSRLSQEIDVITTDPNIGPVEPDDRADAVAVAMVAKARPGTRVHRWEQRARHARRHGIIDAANVHILMNAAVSAALTGLISGEKASTEGVREALTVAGLNNGQNPDTVAESLAAINIDALIRAITTALPADWITARQDLHDLLRFASSYCRVAAHLLPEDLQLPGLADVSSDDPSSAALIPLMLILANDEWRTALRQQLAILNAIEQLLAGMPTRFHPYLNLDEHAQQELARQPNSFRDEFQTALVAWRHAHPDHARTLGHPSPSA
ncbi:hypothetical protein JOF56_004188 [Kibdelosporangium banguiense]|uniref:Uncharacterized protein n=1 Tax=Kibdelosporangium banguiense TaxID=1365924 RepID=A0ABS4TH85_9PSEU|nr:hypothetical protein [Kibdelosporangium banguiense]MBP2323803.1 hypothetical protein [Kibdelosporangium banguiense]